MDPESVVVGQTFTGGRFELDETRYVRCRFVGSTLVYTGDGDFPFDECAFDRCEWVFAGSAKNTVLFLSVLSHELGDSGRDLLASIFEHIRSGQVPSANERSLAGGSAQRAIA